MYVTFHKFMTLVSRFSGAWSWTCETPMFFVLLIHKMRKIVWVRRKCTSRFTSSWPWWAVFQELGHELAKRQCFSSYSYIKWEKLYELDENVRHVSQVHDLGLSRAFFQDRGVHGAIFSQGQHGLSSTFFRKFANISNFWIRTFSNAQCRELSPCSCPFPCLSLQFCVFLADVDDVHDVPDCTSAISSNWRPNFSTNRGRQGDVWCCC